ncbi:MAG: NIPSNAP family protein [Bacteroidales bacterium]|nr:NIPSNAP family protein [Bacteroidales bacterium]
MKNTTLLLLAFSILILSSCTQAEDQTRAEAVQGESLQRDYFQLKIYNFQNEEQEALLDVYFRDALLPALHRNGIQNVGVFKAIEELIERKDFIIVLTPFNSLDHFEKLDALLMEDAEYLQSAGNYLNASHDNPPYARIESMILRSFSATPELVLPDLNTARSERVYELRSYEAATEKLYKLKVEMFNEGESALFQELKFNPVFFCEVLSSAHMPHLIYMTAHADSTAQKENWDAFVNHPEWERMKNLDKYQNTVSNITRTLLYPTEYSDY